MNKGMIMLGLLLIVGLSFAVPVPGGTWQYPWQNTTFLHYACSYAYVSYYQYALAYSYMAPYAGPYQMANMYSALYYMLGHARSLYYDYPATVFKTDMLGYNSDNSLFSGIFNSVLRAFIAHADSGARANILSLLQSYNSNYRDCISPS